MSYGSETRHFMYCDIHKARECAVKIMVEGDGPDEAGNVDPAMKALALAGRANWSVYEGAAACPACVREMIREATRPAMQKSDGCF